jgi:hypothetical protein
MSKPHRWLYWKTKKERFEQAQEAWRVTHELMTNPDVPPVVRLAAAEKRLDRLDPENNVVPTQQHDLGIQIVLNGPAKQIDVVEQAKLVNGHDQSSADALGVRTNGKRLYTLSD